MLLLVLIVFITAGISWYMVKSLIPVLEDKRIIDTPNNRSLHHGAVPRGGGLVIVFLLAITVIVVGAISGRIAMFVALLISLLAWGGLSWLDDQFDLTPRFRLMMQCLFTLISIAAYGSVQLIQLSTDFYIPLSVFGIIASFIGMVWLANLYNFMDGMDGLAAAQTIIASATISFWLWQYGDQSLAITCLVLASASYGFLLWNWHPAKIFMGDVGSVTIGAFFATLILISVSRYEMPVLSFVLLLSVFVADASVTILRRLVRREKIWLPHRSHYYQRLATMGINHSKIVIGLIILMSISSLIATTTLIYRDTIVLGIFIQTALLTACAIAVEYLESRDKRAAKL